MQIERSLVQDNCLVRPVIYLHPEVEKILIAKLKDIVKRHQGTIIDKPSEATHIVYRLPPMAREEGMSGRGLFLSCWRGAHYSGTSLYGRLTTTINSSGSSFFRPKTFIFETQIGVSPGVTV